MVLYVGAREMQKKKTRDERRGKKEEFLFLAQAIGNFISWKLIGTQNSMLIYIDGNTREREKLRTQMIIFVIELISLRYRRLDIMMGTIFILVCVIIDRIYYFFLLDIFSH